LQLSRDLRKVIETGGKGMKDVSLLTPIKPMLAEACKDFKAAVAKYPQGMFAEVRHACLHATFHARCRIQ
jgi:DNA ligase-3